MGYLIKKCEHGLSIMDVHNGGCKKSCVYEL